MDKNQEQGVAKKNLTVSYHKFYSDVLKKIKPLNIPVRFMSHIIAHTDSGEDIFINRDMILDENVVFAPMSVNNRLLKCVNQITHTRTFVDIDELHRKVEKDLDDLFGDRFKN